MAVDPDDTDADDAPTGERTARRSSWLRRVLDGPATAGTPPADSPRGQRRAMERLDGRERRWSFAAAVAALVFAVIIYESETHNHKFHLAKGQLTPQTTLALGLGAAVLLAVATYSGRRAPVAFLCLFSFFVFTNGAGLVAGLPFILLGGWLLYRSFQTQRRAAGRGRAGSGGGATKPASTPAPARAAPRATTAKPQANKRYTPKRPPPGAAKPPRHQRKAAGTKE